MPDSTICLQVAESGLRPALQVPLRRAAEALATCRARFRGWPGLGESAVHEFAMMIRAARPAAEVRATLVYLAVQVAGGGRGTRAELELDDPAGGRPRRVASWPEGGAMCDDGGVPLCLPMLLEGRRVGTLRVVPGGRRGRIGPRAAQRLATLASLAAGTERLRSRSDDSEATRDPASGAYAGGFLNAFLSHALAQARRRREPLSVLCVSADGLAEARARDGSEIADSALRRMARALTGTLRASDVIGRIDGDRLVAVLVGAAAADAPRVAESVRRAILEAGIATGANPSIGCSIGVATFPEHASEAGTLLAAAAEAQARARSQGENRIAAPTLSALSGSRILPRIF